MQPYRRLIESIEAEGAAALVSLVETRGSSPREAGAAMVVRPSSGFHGTIGGGAMEWRALAEARKTLGQGRGASPALSGPATRDQARQNSIYTGEASLPGISFQHIISSSRSRACAEFGEIPRRKAT